MAGSSLRARRSGVDRRSHLLEGAAAANIGDLLIDVSVGRLRPFLEKRRYRHDHTALAIAALRYVKLEPGFLYGVQIVVLGKALDRGDLLAGGRADGERAGPGRN